MNYVKILSLYLRENVEHRKIYSIGSTKMYIHIIIIINKNRYGKTTHSLLRNYLTSRDSYKLLYYDLKIGDMKECNDTINDVKRNFNDGCVLIITVEQSYFKELYNAIKTNNLTYENGYDVIFLNLNELDAYSYEIEDVKFVSHYYDHYTYNGHEDVILESFRSKIKEIIGEDLPLTSLIAIGYNAFQQWSSV